MSIKLDLERFDRDGFAVLPDHVPTHQTADLKSALDTAGAMIRRRNGRVFGARNLLEADQIRALAHALAPTIAEPILGQSAGPVRALFFDKTQEANWPVLWHQDLTIAIAERRDLAGWGPWSLKAGVPHVEPPLPLLQSMVTIRVHLDDCGPDNGPLRVLPGTHRLGRLTRDRIAGLRREKNAVECLADEGALVVMRPLLLHASASARRPDHRRVVHIEYAARDLLPPSLEWAFAPRRPAAAA
jgi:hypothetical protein